MRKCLLLLLVLMMLLSVASAESTICYGGEDEVSAALAGLLSGSVKKTETEAEALDATAADPAAVALVSQQGLILGLQGYTDADVRKDIRLLFPLCRSDLYLVCSADTAEACGVRDFPSLTAFLEEDPFELTLMRCFEASVTDLAAVRVFEALDFETDTFADLADCEENLSAGTYVLAADTAQALRLAEEGYVVLGALTAERTAAFPDLPCAAECGIPVCEGRIWGLYAAAGSPAEWFAELQAAAGALTEERLVELHCEPVGGEAFRLADALREYIDYMTAEGLFFYE